MTTQNLIKFNLYPNSKYPLKGSKWRYENKSQGLLKDYNIGIRTGNCGENPILVVDIDNLIAKFKQTNEEKYKETKESKCGFKKYKSLIKKNGKIDTYTIKTPSNGLHLYFNYTNAIRQTQGIGKYAIDIRSDGGYIVGAGSKLKNGNYKVINDKEIIDMPKWLLDWIMETDDKFIKNKIVKTRKDLKGKKDDNFKENENKNIEYNDLFYPFDRDYLIKLLSSLDSDYVNNTSKWLKITSCLCSMGEKLLWDEWSKGGKSYDEKKNMIFWDYCKKNPLNFSINYLVHLVRLDKDKKNKYPFINATRQYKDMDYKQVDNIYKFNRRYVDDYNPKPTGIIQQSFNKDGSLTEKINYNKETDIKLLVNQQLKNDVKTVFIKSDTGTGKTTYCARLFYKLLDRNEDLKILSIVSRRSLTYQHITSFKKSYRINSKNDIKMMNYRNTYELDEQQFLTIQLDSIIKLDSEDYKNCAVYLDEVNSLVIYLVNSSTLDGKRKAVYKKLIKILRECKYLVCSDADISDLSYEFIKNYRKGTSHQFILNEFKNYKQIKAFDYKSEQLLINKLIDNVKNNKPFCACFDSAKRAREVYNWAMSDYNDNEEIKKKFLLYTSNDGNLDVNINEEWANKFVFYSPKIVYGLDFQPPDKSDVFLFCVKSCRTLDPLQVGQQITRNRKINELHYFIKNKSRGLNFKNIDEVKEYYKLFVNEYIEQLSQYGCVFLDEEDEAKIINNRFSNFYFKFLYIQDTFQSNFKYHIERILKKKGFIIHRDRTTLEMNKKKSLEVKELTETLMEQQLIDIMSGQKKNKDVIEAIERRCELMNVEMKDLYNIEEIPDNETNKPVIVRTLTELGDLITDQNNLGKHFNLNKLLKNNDILEQIQIGNYEKIFKVKYLTNTNSKISIIRKFEKILGIETFNLNDVNEGNKEIEVSDKDFNLYKKIFRVRSKKLQKPTKWYELYYKIVMPSYLSLCPTGVIINMGRSRIEGKQVYIKDVDKEQIKKHIDIIKYRNPTMNNINRNTLENLDIKFMDFNEYMFDDEEE